jgi:hypothetical protein
MSDDKTRNLVLRFWSLASSERREIALHLGLIEHEDIRIPEAERYGRAFQRVGELSGPICRGNSDERGDLDGRMIDSPENISER